MSGTVLSYNTHNISLMNSSVYWLCCALWMLLLWMTIKAIALNKGAYIPLH